jgi:hypothetical protein
MRLLEFIDVVATMWTHSVCPLVFLDESGGKNTGRECDQPDTEQCNHAPSTRPTRVTGYTSP